MTLAHIFVKFLPSTVLILNTQTLRPFVVVYVFIRNRTHAAKVRHVHRDHISARACVFDNGDARYDRTAYVVTADTMTLSMPIFFYYERDNENHQINL